MRGGLGTICWLVGFSWVLPSLAPAGDPAPVPDGSHIKQRVLKSYHESEDALENYSCTVHEQTDELNDDQSVKRHRSSIKEQFFVNHIQIEHTLERDGKPLSPAEAAKEQERVDKLVRRFSEQKEADKVQSRAERRADLFLQALALNHGRREQRGGRNTLLYELAGDPSFHPKKLEERFAQALAGGIAIDEETGTPVEMRFQTFRDVKIGGGLLANLHRGFWLHVVQQREPDGVWITQSVQGSGDARAALFVHARFRFKEELQKCHLFSVKTQQQISAP